MEASQPRNEILVGTTNDVSPRTVRTNWLRYSWSQISGATKVLLIISITLAIIQVKYPLYYFKLLTFELILNIDFCNCNYTCHRWSTRNIMRQTTSIIFDSLRNSSGFIITFINLSALVCT
jgi:hypothetical protein